MYTIPCLRKMEHAKNHSMPEKKISHFFEALDLYGNNALSTN